MNDTRSIYQGTSGAIAYCDHCGFAIYNASELLIVRTTGDRIHRDCWADYAEEHMTELAQCADEDCDF